MADEGATTKGAKIRKTRSRSPNYPILNLADAIERIRTVFDEIARRRVGDEDVAKALGYGALHGKSRSVVSALKKYGLLEPSGDGFRVSDDAMDIITLPSDHPNRARAMRDAALRPTLFAELYETYGDEPPGDSLLKNYLYKKNFNPKVADEVIRLYRDTMDLVSRKIEAYTAADEPTDEQQGEQMQQSREKTGGGATPLGGAGGFAPGVVAGSFARQQHYGLSADCDVYLLFDGEPTKEDIGTLKDYLEIFEKRLRSEGTASGTSTTPPTEHAAADGDISGEDGQRNE